MNTDEPPLTAKPPVPPSPVAPPRTNAKRAPVVRARRAMALPSKPMSTGKFLMVLAGGAVLAVTLVATLHYFLVTSRKPAKPILGEEFRDLVNEMADIAFRPPLHWNIDDAAVLYTYYVQGPKESGFTPLMIFTSVTAPGQMDAFLDEHKRRIVLEEPSTTFISEEEESIDGCRAKSIVYDCDYKENESSPVIRLRTLQYLVKDPSFPVYYKITCHAKKESFPSFEETFKASAMTFHRVEIKGRIKMLPLGK